MNHTLKDRQAERLAKAKATLVKDQAKLDSTYARPESSYKEADIVKAKAVVAKDEARIAKNEADLAKEPSKRGGYHFTRIKGAGSVQVKGGPGVLRHIIYNAPVELDPNIELVDGLEDNSVKLAIDPETIVVSSVDLPATDATPTEMVIKPTGFKPGERRSHAVVEFHTPFQNGLRVITKMGVDITVVWE